MAKSTRTSGFGRRGFLKNAAAGAAGAALATTTPLAEAQGQSPAQAQAQNQRKGNGPAPGPTQAQLERDAGNVRPPAVTRTITRPGSDLMVQVIHDLGVEFAAANPDPASKACRNRSSTTARPESPWTASPSGSPRCMKNRR